jgi:hypothetical protein
VTNTVSPCSARRTYSLSLFFRTFKPTAFIRTNVASGSYECQGRLLNRLVSRNLPFAIPPNAVEKMFK